MNSSEESPFTAPCCAWCGSKDYQILNKIPNEDDYDREVKIRNIKCNKCDKESLVQDIPCEICNKQIISSTKVKYDPLEPIGCPPKPFHIPPICRECRMYHVYKQYCDHSWYTSSKFPSSYGMFISMTCRKCHAKKTHSPHDNKPFCDNNLPEWMLRFEK
jgi:hypothetical protein